MKRIIEGSTLIKIFNTIFHLETIEYQILD